MGGISSSVAERAGCGGGGGGGMFAEESTTSIWEGFVLTGELWRNTNGEWWCVGPKVQQTPTWPWDQRTLMTFWSLASATAPLGSWEKAAGVINQVQDQ